MAEKGRWPKRQFKSVIGNLEFHIDIMLIDAVSIKIWFLELFF